ncbi:hypothetical protein BKA64DRAFT_635557 [Cadophora sp. MPI-SDFR-AT-0126]|nr:hypothetical protein BKA64DRAFT_635557 [Leotiomycetes sp. MPI-SDFR-AT-0126]
MTASASSAIGKGKLMNPCATFTLIVGPQKSKIAAPRALLAFYSRFFDTAFYDTFAESRTDTIDLPEDDTEEILTFVLWAKTGQLYSNVPLESLWALGKRLQSDPFTNEVMFCMFGRDRNLAIIAKDAELAYSLTIPGSKLRAYTRRLIIYEGPLRHEELVPEDEKARREDWGRLIHQGGDLVYDIIVEERASFSQDEDDHSRAPYYHTKHNLYLEEISEMSAEEFIEAKRKEGKL